MPVLNQVIKGIRQTEKSTRIGKHQQYVLDVARDANKIEIKQAAEALFKVDVLKVNTQSYQGKWRRLSKMWGRRPDWKKAVVTVKEGQTIEWK